MRRTRFFLNILLLLWLSTVLTCCSDEGEDSIAGWHKLVDDVVPYPCDKRAVAFDTDRQVLIVHGGNSLADTWEFDGQSWREIQPIESPPKLANSAACYASDFRRMFLFGGRLGGEETNSLWGYDGATWREYETEERPQVRSRAAMCYDEARKCLIVFGGTSDAVASKCTWEWDGTTWISVITEHYPVSIYGHRMVYDSVRGRVVLFGGNRNGTLNQDTWVYDGQDWTKLDIAEPPPKRFNHALGFDARSGDVLMAGGFQLTDSYVSYKDFWRFDGTTWREVASFQGVTQFDKPFLAVPADSPDYWLFCSREGNTETTHYTMMYHLNDGSLVPFRTPNVPHPSLWPGLIAFDRSSRRFLYVLQGDLNAGPASTIGVWWWTQAGWVHAAPLTGSPQPLLYIAPIAIAYDGRRETVVLFPRQNVSSSSLSQHAFTFFEFHDDEWVKRQRSDGPRLLDGFSVVYDEKRGKLVLFGGYLRYIYNRLCNDTWEYDGETWVNIPIKHAPAPRNNASLAYDSRRGTVFLFGGTNIHNQMWRDTWELDGQTWRFVPTLHAPEKPGTLAYDHHHGRMLYLCSYSSGNYHDGPIEIWQFDGEDWSRVAYDHGPSQRSYAAVAVDTYDPRIVLAGGEFVTGSYYTDTYFIKKDVWELRP